MFDSEVFGYEFVLGADVVVERDFGEVFEGGVVGGRGGFAVAEEGGDDDEVLGFDQKKSERVLERKRRREWI